MSLEKVTVFKIKSSVTAFEDFVRSEDAKGRRLPPLQPLELPEELDLDVEAQAAAAFKVHIGAPKTEDDVPWLAFLNEGKGLNDKISFKSQNRFPSAIAVLKVAEQDGPEFYALTFGLGGESFLRTDSVVRDFGIRVAMNICDKENLKRVQTSIHESISTQSEKQLSVGSRFSVFNIDDQKEFLRAISGAAMPGYEYIKSFTGRDSIAIRIDKDDRIDWLNIIPRIRSLASAYSQDQYKERFPGYDKFHFETDREKIDKLDQNLFAEIRDGHAGNVHLAPPEFIDFDTRSFSYSDNDDAALFDDLTLEDLLASKKRPFSDRSSIGSIKGMRIYVWDAETERQIKSWSAYKCLVAEVELDNSIYILSMGQWKQVSDGLKADVDDYVSEIPIARDQCLPDRISIWDPQARRDRNGNFIGQDREAIYNATAAESADLFLFDTAKIEVAGDKIYEICDLFHKDNMFVHVKRFRSGAASVTHLFVQGRFYGEAFLSDPNCRAGMRDYILRNVGDGDPLPFIDSIPEDRDDLIANEYRIVFCVLSDRVDIALNSLPFMARYELMYTHRYLHNALGFRCELAFRTVQLGG